MQPADQSHFLPNSQGWAPGQARAYHHYSTLKAALLEARISAEDGDLPLPLSHIHSQRIWDFLSIYTLSPHLHFLEIHQPDPSLPVLTLQLCSPDLLLKSQLLSPHSFWSKFPSFVIPVTSSQLSTWVSSPVSHLQGLVPNFLLSARCNVTRFLKQSLPFTPFIDAPALTPDAFSFWHWWPCRIVTAFSSDTWPYPNLKELEAAFKRKSCLCP